GSAMAIDDEDVAIRGDPDCGWLVEFVRTIACNSGLAERHQYFSARAKLEGLHSFSVFRLKIGDPNVSLFVYRETVGNHKHSGAEALQKLAGCIEFEDGIFGRADACVSAAPIEHPDVPGAIDRYFSRCSPRPALRKLRPVFDGLIRI